MNCIEPNKEAEHEKENSNPEILPANKEEKKEAAGNVGKEESKKGEVIVVGADVGQGKLQKKFEKFRKLRIVMEVVSG